MKRLTLMLILALALAAPFVAAQTVPPPVDPARELQLLLRNPTPPVRVLYVTAHPDDEDAGLLAWLRFHIGAETTLMTLTRGEGGQNEIGTELHGALGVLRSRELEAAGAYTWANQYFSSAYDFGYSFSVEETLERWDKDLVLSEIVQMIRLARPHVVLTLPHDGEGGGQHHQASARLALEACKLAADPNYNAADLPPFQTSRLFEVVWEDGNAENPCDIDLSGYDPVLGGSYAEVGVWSRSRHKCQGMARRYDPHAARVSRWNFLWSADPGDAPRSLGTFWDGLPQESPPWASLPAPGEDGFLSGLVEAWAALSPEFSDTFARISRERLGRAIELASGVDIVARAERAYVAETDTSSVTVGFRPGSEVQAVNISLWTGWGRMFSTSHSDARLTAGSGSQATLFHVLGESPPAGPGRGIHARWHGLWARPKISLHGAVINLDFRPVWVQNIDAEFPGLRWTSPQVVPDPSVRFITPRAPLIALNGQEPLAFLDLAVSTLKPEHVDIRFQAPEDIRVVPAEIQVPTTGGGAETTIQVAVFGDPSGPVTLIAEAESHPLRVSRHGYQRISYPHINASVYVEEAEVELLPARVAVSPRRVGYIEGTGDRIPEALNRLGVDVQLLEPEDLRGGLEAYDVLVTGVRAYKVRDDLIAASDRLRRWMEGGGHLVVMYNKFEFNAGEEESPFAPYPGFRVTSDRVTDETAPVDLLIRKHHLLKAPNTLNEHDWEGWVQERGLYFARVENPAYQELLGLEDPFPYNPGRKTGSLVWTPVGRGSWTYVGLGLFRQLPAGVPGAYRLLANLVSQ